MARQVQPIFLEEWLRSNSDSSSSSSSSIPSSPWSARAIIEAWANLRDSLQYQAFHPQHLQSLKTLLSSHVSLYVADPQAKLLLSILSSPHLSLPPESYPLFLRLLYIWVRKSFKPSPQVIDFAVEVLCRLLSPHFDFVKSSLFFSKGVLLLGALSFAPSISERSKTDCLEYLCRLLEEDYKLTGLFGGFVSNFLAGIGYALCSAGNGCLVRILDSLLGVWYKEGGTTSSAFHGLMILHMTEWVVSNFINASSFEKVALFTRETLETTKPTYASFAVVMVAAGVLRASGRSESSSLMQIRISAGKRIEIVATELIPKSVGATIPPNEPRDGLLLQCISLALARSGFVSAQPALLICLASALVTEIFPLKRFYLRTVEYFSGGSAGLGLKEVKEHMGSAIFKEAGSVTGIFCKRYLLADDANKSIVENLIWDYCQDVYSWHQRVALMLRGIEDELLGELEKIAESAFLMVVVFALTVTKNRLDSRFNRDTQLEVSVRILVSFSCMEYFRRMRLPEYMDTIRGVVVSVQENESACVSFVESMPPYNYLTTQHDSFSLPKTGYTWFKDEVQTARILFYLRVIPTCVERLPSSVYRKVVAPTIFLYMGHPNGKVARASHLMFAAFMSSGKDSDQVERVLLKEQLVYYYIKRSVEGYPGTTPFEGMASGVAAIVRHLPAGSPSIFYCIHGLVEKANSLCNEVRTRGTGLGKNWLGESEPCNKVIELLLRLLSMVDIQVLPSLMKLLAQLIVQLPQGDQNMVLNELYAQVAESDDVTRKPALVSWLQSLSYLCSQAISTTATKEVGNEVNAAASWNNGTLTLNRINSRL